MPKTQLISTIFRIGSYQRLKGYLLLLEENGLIEYDKEKCIYKTTEKGLHTLQAYNGMRELIDYC